MQKYILSSWQESNIEQLDPKLSQRVFTTANVMVVHYTYEPGLNFGNHSHPQEQVTLVQSGRLAIDVEGEVLELKRGDILCVFPHVEHASVVLGDEPVESINIFTPISERVIINK